jgi:hypothetical protein
VTPLEAARAFAVAETAERSALAGKVLPFEFGCGTSANFTIPPDDSF